MCNHSQAGSSAQLVSQYFRIYRLPIRQDSRKVVSRCCSQLLGNQKEGGIHEGHIKSRPLIACILCLPVAPLTRLLSPSLPLGSHSNFMSQWSRLRPSLIQYTSAERVTRYQLSNGWRNMRSTSNRTPYSRITRLPPVTRLLSSEDV